VTTTCFPETSSERGGVEETVVDQDSADFFGPVA
jgi:hypothetical protein